MVLSLDLATIKTGWSLFSKNGSLLEYGLVRTENKEIDKRIKEIYSEIKSILFERDVETIVFEDVPLTAHNNLKTGKDLVKLQGVILSLCFEYNLNYKMYNPSAWRSILGLYNGSREGTKRAYQKQVAIDKVNQLYKLNFVYNETETKTRLTDDDKAEAICLGLAYIKDLENKEENNENI